MTEQGAGVPGALLGKGVAVLLDLLMVVGYVYGVPILVARFQALSWFNGVLLVGAFVLPAAAQQS